jgi:hypothetical protein
MAAHPDIAPQGRPGRGFLQSDRFGLGRALVVQDHDLKPVPGASPGHKRPHGIVNHLFLVADRQLHGDTRTVLVVKGRANPVPLARDDPLALPKMKGNQPGNSQGWQNRDPGQCLDGIETIAPIWTESGSSPTVVSEGYLWREVTYASVQTIARAITGTAWSGRLHRMPLGYRVDGSILHGLVDASMKTIVRFLCVLLALVAPAAPAAAQTASQFYSVPTVAALQALTTRPAQVYVSGYTSPTDLHGGMFTWSAGVSSTADGYNVVQPTSGPAGRWLRGGAQAVSNYLVANGPPTAPLTGGNTAINFVEAGGLNQPSLFGAGIAFDMTNTATNKKHGIFFSIRATDTSGTINTQAIAANLYTPPDNGGDSSGFTSIQTGGGNAASFFNLNAQRPSTTFTGSIATTVLTVTTPGAFPFEVGQEITGSGVTAGTVISSLGTGTGGPGTYNLNHSQTVTSRVLVQTFKSFPSQGRALEATADSFKNAIVAQADSGAAYLAYVNSSDSTGAGLIVLPVVDGDTTRRAIHVGNAANTLEAFSVDLAGKTLINANDSALNHLTIQNLGSTGPHIKLTDNSGLPNKYIRVNSGVFQILNSGYSAALTAVDDTGNMTIPATIRSNTGFNVAGTIGASLTVTVRKGDDSGPCNLAFVGGLFVSTTCAAVGRGGGEDHSHDHDLDIDRHK